VASDDAGRLITAGGRALNVVGFGPTLSEARARAYSAVDCISWPGMYFRQDIAEEAERR
jgi:phosphoribosylamine--glycine ligase